MPVLEALAATATIASFLRNVNAGGQSQDKIRDSLQRCEMNLSEVMKLLDDFKEDLTLEERKIYIDWWQLLDAEASDELAQTIEEGNPFKRLMKHSNMKRTARRIEYDTIKLRSHIQLSSRNGRLRKDEDPANLERKIKEMEIRDMELEIRHKEAMQKLGDLNIKPAEGS